MAKMANGQPHPDGLPYGQSTWFKSRGVPKRTELTATQLEFVEWLCDMERQGTQVAFAADHGVAGATLTTWKRDPLFIEHWNNRLKELNVHPVRIQRVLDAIWTAAIGGDTKAASLYLQYVERFTPKQQIIVRDKAISEMSDSELADSLREVGGR